jgi:hypothetical protein
MFLIGLNFDGGSQKDQSVLNSTIKQAQPDKIIKPTSVNS